MEVSGQLHALATLFPGKNCIGSWVGHRTGLDMVGERNNIPCNLTLELNSSCPVHSPVTILTELYYLAKCCMHSIFFPCMLHALCI
jgi:hypothetical protein